MDIQTLRLIIDERDEPLIEISSDPINQYIKLIYDGEEIDYYDKQDFSCDNFLFIPPGEGEFFDPGVREPARREIAYKEEYIAH